MTDPLALWGGVNLDPVDRVALRVMLPGVHYEPAKKSNQPIWEDRPRTTGFPGLKKDDLTGKTQGRLKVIGYFGKKHWLVKCNCGRYETRKAPAIKNPNNRGDRRQICRHLAFQKRNQEFLMTGTNKKEAADY